MNIYLQIIYVGPWQQRTVHISKLNFYTFSWNPSPNILVGKHKLLKLDINKRGQRIFPKTKLKFSQVILSLILQAFRNSIMLL